MEIETGVNNKISVLLIEDNELNQLYYSELLDSMNLDYIICEGEANAVTEFSKNNFQLVISDVNLKDGNGIQFLKHVNKTNNKIPCILISGSSESELIEKYGNFNFVKFLTKPIRKNDFLSAVSTCLQHSTPLSKENIHVFAKYNYDNLRRTLKNDSEKINTCLSEFLELVSKSILEVKQTLVSKNAEPLRPLFHDLLNICPFFGADFLFDLIMNYRREEDIERKVLILPSIQEELTAIKNFYTSPSFKII